MTIIRSFGRSFNSKHNKGALTASCVDSGFFVPQNTMGAGSQSHSVRGLPPPGRSHRYVSSCDWAVGGSQDSSREELASEMFQTETALCVPEGAGAGKRQGREVYLRWSDRTRFIFPKALPVPCTRTGGHPGSRDNKWPCRRGRCMWAWRSSIPRPAQVSG